MTSKQRNGHHQTIKITIGDSIISKYNYYRILNNAHECFYIKKRNYFSKCFAHWVSLNFSRAVTYSIILNYFPCWFIASDSSSREAALTSATSPMYVITVPYCHILTCPIKCHAAPTSQLSQDHRWCPHLHYVPSKWGTSWIIVFLMLNRVCL